MSGREAISTETVRVLRFDGISPGRMIGSRDGDIHNLATYSAT